MSAGENMLISLLHMLNVVIVRPAKSEDVRLILIDEIELALHPSAIMRLVDFCKNWLQSIILLYIFQVIQ